MKCRNHPNRETKILFDDIPLCDECKKKKLQRKSIHDIKIYYEKNRTRYVTMKTPQKVSLDRFLGGN